MSVSDRDEMGRLRSEYIPMLLRTIAARMQMRVDAILERDRDERVAIEGRGAGISFLFARDIVHALEAGHDEVERQAARIATLEAALASEYTRGAEQMRRACVAVAQPLGTYSNTPEMQSRLATRCEITDTIASINLAPTGKRQEEDRALADAPEEGT